MIPFDSAFEEVSTKNNSGLKIASVYGVLGLVSVCVAVFVIFLCAKKDSKSKRKKVSTDSRQDLLEHQVSPIRHGIENRMYTINENGTGERQLDRNVKSVIYGSTPWRGNEELQNSTVQHSQTPTSPQHAGFINQNQAPYDSPTSNKPIQTTPNESPKNPILSARSHLRVKSSSVPCDENLDSDDYLRQNSADELYLIPKSNKPIDERKPLPSPNLVERPKMELPGASDPVKDVHCELSNTPSNSGTSMYAYPNSAQKVNLEKSDDNHHEPWTGNTQVKLLSFSPPRQGKLSQSELEIAENKFQYQFNSRTKSEGDTESLYVVPTSNKSIDETKLPRSLNLGERPKMKPLGSKTSTQELKASFAESAKRPDMPVYKYPTDNRKEIFDKFDNNQISPTDKLQAVSIAPSQVKPLRSPLHRSEAEEDTLQYQLAAGLNSTNDTDALYVVPKSSKPIDERKPFSLPKLVDRSKTKLTDGADMINESEIESKEPQTRLEKGPIYAHAASNKRENLEQKDSMLSPTSDKTNAQSVVSFSKSAGLSTTRTAADESKFQNQSHSDSKSKMYTEKEADPKRNIYTAVHGKQAPRIEAKMGRKEGLVLTKDDAVDDDVSYTVLQGVKAKSSEKRASCSSTKNDPGLYENNMFAFPEVGLPPPPPCHFRNVHVPNTTDTEYNKSVTNDVFSETKDRADYINCAEFSKKNDNLKGLPDTKMCPPAPCLTHRYVNIPHTSNKELEEDDEYVAMHTQAKHELHAVDKSIAKYANILDIHVPQASEKPKIDEDMYLPMTKHLSHAISDTYLYQNAVNTQLKENKRLYENSSHSGESTPKRSHDNEQDDTYCYAAVDFFLKNKMAADAAKRSECKTQKPPLRSTSFNTTTSAEENDIRIHSSKPQKLPQTASSSKNVLTEKTSLATVPPPQNAKYK